VGRLAGFQLVQPRHGGGRGRRAGGRRRRRGGRRGPRSRARRRGPSPPRRGSPCTRPRRRRGRRDGELRVGRRAAPALALGLQQLVVVAEAPRQRAGLHAPRQVLLVPPQRVVRAQLGAARGILLRCNRGRDDGGGDGGKIGQSCVVQCTFRSFHIASARLLVLRRSVYTVCVRRLLWELRDGLGGEGEGVRI
jgi:hypothetical protein